MRQYTATMDLLSIYHDISSSSLESSETLRSDITIAKLEDKWRKVLKTFLPQLCLGKDERSIFNYDGERSPRACTQSQNWIFDLTYLTVLHHEVMSSFIDKTNMFFTITWVACSFVKELHTHNSKTSIHKIRIRCFTLHST